MPADESSCCQSTLEPPISISVSLETYPDDLPVAEINPLHIAVASNAEGNVTYTCTINNGNVIWQLGSCGSEEEGRLYYQMVDRDQFLPNGVITQQSNATLSTLMLLEEGRQYLSDRLQSNVIYVQCLAVVDKLNVYSGERHTVELYGMCMHESPHSQLLYNCNVDHNSTLEPSLSAATVYCNVDHHSTLGISSALRYICCQLYYMFSCTM